MAERLGIVYTPVEVVDFILRSVQHALQKHFKTRIGDKEVQVLDPFSGTGTFPVVGSYDEVAETFRKLSEAGVDGMAVGLVNYIDDFPALRDEVLPRMQRLGLRQ